MRLCLDQSNSFVLWVGAAYLDASGTYCCCCGDERHDAFLINRCTVVSQLHYMMLTVAIWQLNKGSKKCRRLLSWVGTLGGENIGGGDHDQLDAVGELDQAARFLDLVGPLCR